ncbi:MAG: class I SAM-dependent methyltransferase [Cyanobacteriota bacterium]|nr:class I SAM-dependent methyltransferase [Cyanobacteriota bacterium]
MFHKIIKQWNRLRLGGGNWADGYYAVMARSRTTFVSEILPKRGVGAELGVFKGHFSRILLEHAHPTQLHLIDPWFLHSPHWGWARGNQSTVDASVRVIQAFKREIEARRVYVHIGFDIDVLSTFPDNHFDWVYIDSLHTYEHAKAELSILSCKVKDRGVIAGDDWWPNPSHPHHGVFRAVTEFVEFGEFEIAYSDSKSSQWAIKRSQ